MRRRDFICLLGSGIVARPLSASAQQRDQVRRIGVLSPGSRTAFSNEALAFFAKSLEALGWTDGKNVRIDYRWAENNAAQRERLADDLLGLKPDVILASTTVAVATLQRKTTTTPIVFVAVGDPIASGLVASIAHPGANITGFSNFESTLVGKYIEILKDVIPGLTAVRFMFDTEGTGRSVVPLLEAAAQYHGVEIIATPVRSGSEIEAVISRLGDQATTGLVVAGEPFMVSNLDLIVSLTTHYRVRTVYSFRLFVVGGGLISYGNDLVDQYRQAAAYIDRLLKGANPSDLPVQAPVKFELVINLKAAKDIGVTISPALLGRADEVIE